MRYLRRRDLGFALHEDGAVFVRAQGAGIAARVPPAAVGLLIFFGTPRTLEEAQTALGPTAGPLVEGLLRVGLVVPEGEAEQTPQFFDNFAALDIHRRMLTDGARVEAYRRALDKVVRPGSRVLDAGTGTGVLAALAARAGAGAVVAVDNSAILDRARQVFEDSGLAEVVRCVRSDFGQVELDAPVDVIVTETFGALALAEGAAEDLSRCCARNLAPGGVVIPHALSLLFAPVIDSAEVEPLYAPWEVDGVDLSSLQRAQELRGVTRAVQAECVGEPVVLARVDFPQDAVRVRGTLRFEGLKGRIHGLCGWFDLHLAPGVDLPTGPSDPPTHWQQVLLPLVLDPVAGVVQLELTVEPAPEDRRGLLVRADWEGGSRSWRVR